MVPLWTEAKSGVCVVRLTEASEVEELVRLFGSVADAEGWQPGPALRLWCHRSVHYAAEVQGRLAGGIQLVLPDPSGTLPWQDLWPEASLGASDRCAHVAVLAIGEAYRGRPLLFWRLVVEVWRWCVGEGIATLTFEVTPRVLPLYRRLGWPLEVVGGLRPHWGEECYLCTLDIAGVAASLLRRAEHSAYYRRIIAQAFRVSLPSEEALSTAVG